MKKIKDKITAEELVDKIIMIMAEGEATEENHMEYLNDIRKLITKHTGLK